MPQIISLDGMTPKIDPSCFIAENAVIIGDVEIGAGSSVWYGCVIRGDVNRIRIGRNTNIQDGTVIHCNHDPAGDYRETGGGMPTIIGSDITIGHMALLHACQLEDGCFIGMKACVMDLAVVESKAMVAAGALVTPKKRVLSGELWGGNPARKLRDLSQKDTEFLAYSARNYVKNGVRFRARQEEEAKALAREAFKRNRQER